MSIAPREVPDCKTLTAVAIGPEYECHSCGRSSPPASSAFRVPGATAARQMMPSPRRCRSTTRRPPSIEEDSLPRRSSRSPPTCRCGRSSSAAAAARTSAPSKGLRRATTGSAVVWFDAHGDLNTPESSPSGNEWGMPLRMIIDGGAVDAEDVALVGARNLDPPEVEFIAAAGIHDTVQAVLDRVDCVYVAIDFDVFEPRELAVFMPEPGGPSSPMSSGSSPRSPRSSDPRRRRAHRASRPTAATSRSSSA